MLPSDFLSIFFDEATESLEQWQNDCLSLEKDLSNKNILQNLFRIAHNLKGSSRSVGIHQLEKFIHHIEDLISHFKNTTDPMTEKTLWILLDSQVLIMDWIEFLKEDLGVEKDYSHILERVRSVLPKKTKKEEESSYMGFQLFEDLSLENTDPQQSSSSSSGVFIQKKNQDSSIRIPIEKIDMIIRMASELSVQQTMIKSFQDEYSISERLKESISMASKITFELQSYALSLRMQPLSGMFQRMEFIAKDVARSQGKNVKISIVGDDVEIDKIVLEKMKDPLMHIIRNAVDHGLETESNREKSGKSKQGTILIEGVQTASHVLIRIKDDGQGLKIEKILKKAKEKNLIRNAQHLTPKEIIDLIFLPGFSTAEHITDISGRGVGMDVVKTTVESLNGEISIRSKENEGTEFLISLPSTMSILDAVIVDLNGSYYAAPLQDIEEVVNISENNSELLASQSKVLKLRGNIVPLKNMKDFLRIPASIDHHSKNEAAIITHFHDQKVAFEVTRVQGIQSIVVRKLEEQVSAIQGFSGATILSNGEPSMIIDLHAIAKEYISQIEEAS